MTTAAAQAALADFEKDLSRADQLLGLIVDFRNFAATAGPQNKAANWDDTLQLINRAHEVRPFLPVLSGSLLMYVCGRFENFVRAVVGTIVDDLVDKSERYEELPDALRKEHLQRTLLINQNPSRYNLSMSEAIAFAGDLAASLASVGEKQDPLRLDSSIITITEANMNSETIAELFRRVGTRQLWDTLGKQSALQAYLGKTRESDCTRAAKEKVDEVMSMRNKIAHPTTDTVFPDADGVQEIAKYFLILARVLVDFAAVAALKN